MEQNKGLNMDKQCDKHVKEGTYVAFGFNPHVNQQRELFKAYEKHRDYDHYMAYKKVIDEEIEEFLAKNYYQLKRI